MLLSNGSMIKQDVIQSFNVAVENPDNVNDNGSINWDFVSSDMVYDLGSFYNYDYINDCMDALADDYEGEDLLTQYPNAVEQLNILKSDFLGM